MSCSTLLRNIRLLAIGITLFSIPSFLLAQDCDDVGENSFDDLCVEQIGNGTSGPSSSNMLDFYDLAAGADGSDGIMDVQITIEATVCNSGCGEGGPYNIGGCIGGNGALGTSSDFAAAFNNGNGENTCEGAGGYIIYTIDFLNGFSSTAMGFDLDQSSNNGSSEGYEGTFGWVTAGTDASGNPLTGLPTVTMSNFCNYTSTDYATTQMSTFLGATGPGSWQTDSQNTNPNNTGAMASDANGQNICGTTTSEGGEDTSSGTGADQGDSAASANPNLGLNPTDKITQIKYVYFYSSTPSIDCDGDGLTAANSNPSGSWVGFDYCGPAASACPVIDAISAPAETCPGSDFTISATGLDDMAMGDNGDQDFGIDFMYFPGSTPPAAGGAYTGGTSLGTIGHGALTGTDPSQTATLTGVGGGLSPGTYQICAVLSPAPTDSDCRPQVCTSIEVLAQPRADITDGGAADEDGDGDPHTETICCAGAPEATLNILEGTAAIVTAVDPATGVTGNMTVVGDILMNGNTIDAGPLMNTTTSPQSITYTICPYTNGPDATDDSATGDDCVASTIINDNTDINQENCVTHTVTILPCPEAAVTGATGTDPDADGDGDPYTEEICSGDIPVGLHDLVVGDNAVITAIDNPDGITDLESAIGDFLADGDAIEEGALVYTGSGPATICYTICPYSFGPDDMDDGGAGDDCTATTSDNPTLAGTADGSPSCYTYCITISPCPSIAITKDDNDDMDDTQGVVNTGTATFSIEVCNDGTERLCDIALTDMADDAALDVSACALSSADITTAVMAVGNNDAFLDPNECFTYTCEVADVTQDFINTISVTATGCDPTAPSDEDVEDEDPSEVTVVCPAGLAAATAPPVIITAESMCGADGLPAGGVLSAPTGSCPVGSTLEYSLDGTSWSSTLPSYDQNNSITVSTRCACDVDASVVSDPTEVVTTPELCPVITVDKEDNDDMDDSQTVDPTQTGMFVITICNPGSEPLCDINPMDTATDSDVDLSDCNPDAATVTALIMAQGNGDAMLDPDECISYTCDVPNLTRDFTNTMLVEAIGCTTDTPVDDEDTSEVEVPCPANCDGAFPWDGKSPFGSTMLKSSDGPKQNR